MAARRSAMLGDWLMAAPYDTATPLQSLIRVSQTLRHVARRPCALAPLVLMHDRDRTPDIEALAARMPQGSALIMRETRAAHRTAQGLARAMRLRATTRARGVQLLVSGDPALALEIGADGLHFGRDFVDGALAAKAARPGLVVTVAGAKGGRGRGMGGLDAVLVSSVFSSRSASAGTPLGVAALKARVAASSVPVFALGGITAETAPQLLRSGASGLAAIDGFAQALRTAPMPVAPNPPNKGQDTIPADGNARVSVSKQEGGELITYIAEVEGAPDTGELTLRRVADGVWNANHTGVPNSIGGKGVGTALVEAMAADARAQGWRIVPGCPFVAKLFERKPALAQGIT